MFDDDDGLVTDSEYESDSFVLTQTSLADESGARNGFSEPPSVDNEVTSELSDTLSVNNETSETLRNSSTSAPCGTHAHENETSANHVTMSKSPNVHFRGNVDISSKEPIRTQRQITTTENEGVSGSSQPERVLQSTSASADNRDNCSKSSKDANFSSLMDELDSLWG